MRAVVAFQAAILAGLASPQDSFAGEPWLQDRRPDRTSAGAGPASAQPYAAYMAEAARRFAIPGDWILAVMQVESRGDPRAISRAGAMGLMQIMPATWRELAARHGLGADPFDARANIHAGAAYLRTMWDRYGTLEATLAAYNAGPGRTDGYLAGRASLPAETVDYVARLTRMLGGTGHPAAVRIAAADPLAWRRAALFAGSLRDAQADLAAARVDAGAMPPDAPSDAGKLDNETPQHPLFVTPSGWTTP